MVSPPLACRLYCHRGVVQQSPHGVASVDHWNPLNDSNHSMYVVYYLSAVVVTSLTVGRQDWNSSPRCHIDKKTTKPPLQNVRDCLVSLPADMEQSHHW